MDGKWVFGAIERESGKCFFAVVDDRSQDTLIPIIQRYIAPGTTIISDCWRSYNSLKDLGYTHLTVNHSKNFKDPDTGAHTNKIESTWHSLKASLPKTGTQKSLYDSYFSEYVVRKKYLVHAEDKFIKCLDLIKYIYNPNKQDILLADKENVAPTSPPSAAVSSDSTISLDHSYWDTSMDLFLD